MGLFPPTPTAPTNTSLVGLRFDLKREMQYLFILIFEIYRNVIDLILKVAFFGFIIADPV